MSRAVRRRAAGTPACGVSALAILALVTGCASRRDFVPPPAPAPLPGQDMPTDLPRLTGPLTADAAVRLARARNPDLRMAAARVEGARARLTESAAGFWPRLSVDAGYLGADAPSAFLFRHIDARALPPGVDFNDPGTFGSFEAGLGLRWNLWNGGRDLLGRWSADAAAQEATATRQATENGLVAAVVGAWLAARAAGELAAADTVTIRSVGAQVDETRVEVEGGSALRSDLLSLEVRLAEVRQQRVRSEVAERLALASLRELLALPADAAIELAPSPLTTAPMPDDRGVALAEAYRHRPEAQAARHRVEQAALRLESARRAYLPRVDLAARLYGDEVSTTSGFGGPNWTIALALSIDLFDGLGREARIRRARAAVDEVGWADQRTLLEIAREVETAYAHLDEARARLEVATHAVGAAEETFRLVGIRYRGGADTVTRFLETEAARARARTNEIRARLDAERAAIEVARAVGMLYGDPAPEPMDGDA